MTNPGLQIFEAGFRAGTAEAMVFVDIDRDTLERMYNRTCLPLVTDSKAIEALRLHVAFEAVPADRGGPNGPKGRAWAAFIKARDEALA